MNQTQANTEAESQSGPPPLSWLAPLQEHQPGSSDKNNIQTSVALATCGIFESFCVYAIQTQAQVKSGESCVKSKRTLVNRFPLQHLLHELFEARRKAIFFSRDIHRDEKRIIVHVFWIPHEVVILEPIGWRLALHKLLQSILTSSPGASDLSHPLWKYPWMSSLQVLRYYNTTLNRSPQTPNS